MTSPCPSGSGLTKSAAKVTPKKVAAKPTLAVKPKPVAKVSPVAKAEPVEKAKPVAKKAVPNNAAPKIVPKKALTKAKAVDKKVALKKASAKSPFSFLTKTTPTTKAGAKGKLVKKNGAHHQG